jgi:hypothetical protein
MLASTVQFSNNDQPPITPSYDECTGAGNRRQPHGHTFRHPTACPTRPIPHHVPRRSSTCSD